MGGKSLRLRKPSCWENLARRLLAFVGSALAWYLLEMEVTRRMLRLFTCLTEAVKGMLRHEKPRAASPPAMIGLSPSARGLTGRPTDIAEHAIAVAREWEDVAEAYVQKRMRELGIPEAEIGAPDYDRSGERHAFLPDEMEGGTNDDHRRLFVDSGALNAELNAQVNGPEATGIWAKSRLRDRIDSVIAHEHLEAQGVSHDEVVERVADTPLPISEKARRILRATAEGVKRKR
jgi:hypothetical protein